MDAVIGLGSNLGDRRAYLGSAVRDIAALGRIVAASAVYETAPVGGPPQGDYWNAAVRLETELGPQALLDALLAIERAHGRERLERWAPRTLDLDVLWIRGLRVDRPGLRVPHPRLAERTFALVPLLDVAPDAADPATGVSYAELVSGLDATGMRRLGERLALP